MRAATPHRDLTDTEVVEKAADAADVKQEDAKPDAAAAVKAE